MPQVLPQNGGAIKFPCVRKGLPHSFRIWFADDRRHALVLDRHRVVTRGIRVLANGSEFHACARASVLVLRLVRSVLLCGLGIRGHWLSSSDLPRIRAIEMVWTYFRLCFALRRKKQQRSKTRQEHRYL